MVHSVSSETDFGNNIPKIEGFCSVLSVLRIVKPEPVENSLPAENPDEEVWVTVYGCTNENKESVLQEFGKCGVILDYDHSGRGNWVHILFQNQTEAQKALSKSGKQIKKDLIVGVNSVDSIQKLALNRREQISNGAKDRIRKAFHDNFSLLHRSKGKKFVLDDTGTVYNVTLSTTPSCRCTCRYNVPCKHILFVFLRALGISQNDCRIWRKGLKPSQLADLRNMPTSAQTLAGAHARTHEKFLRLFSMSEVNVGPPKIADGNAIAVRCPECYQHMCWGEEVLICEQCWDVGHKSCLTGRRKRDTGKAPVCARCREEWVRLVLQRLKYRPINAP
ncbi:hypothetical protein MKW98_026933 [Papaver atlanticum]|uniref:Uncharacterized protein n=1 Tax=Papaver atlanticum TaxID=357466 RepID=A0AAD4STJ5_9MAGN|nr:hypothetical protein MKW98_026933 [Papaver atlanticum]